MEKYHPPAYLFSLHLNNIGVHLLSIGNHKQGASVLSQAVSLLRGHFRLSSCTDERRDRLTPEMKKAQKLLLRSSEASPLRIQLEILTYESSFVPLVSLEANVTESDPLRLVAFNSLSFVHDHERDTLNETIVSVNNLAASYVLLLQGLSVEDKVNAERLKRSCTEVFRRAHHLIHCLSMAVDDEVSQLRLLTLTLLVCGNELIWDRINGANDRAVLLETYDGIVRQIRLSPVYSWFNGQCLAGAPAA